MDFEFTDDQLELRDTARSILTSACPPSLVRDVYEGRDVDGGLWKQLVDLDWPAIGIPEQQGGLGLGFVEVSILVEELGRVVAPTPFLATVTQFAPLCGEALLPEVAAGSLTGTMARAEGEARRRDGGWVLDGRAAHVVDGATADQIAVVLGDRAFLVRREAVTARPVPTIDPTLPLAEIVLDGVAVSDDLAVLDGAVVERAVEVATTAMALSTVATCRAIFETTLQYAKDREQFGRPIGSFQALKHRLADMFIALERASALAYFATLTIAEDDERRAAATSMAKAAAGDCARLLVQDGLQLHGGIGYTWENDLHFLLKRAKVGDALFGSSAFHRARLARTLGLVE